MLPVSMRHVRRTAKKIVASNARMPTTGHLTSGNVHSALIHAKIVQLVKHVFLASPLSVIFVRTTVQMTHVRMNLVQNA